MSRNVATRIATAGDSALNASSVCWSVTRIGTWVNVSMKLILKKTKCVLSFRVRQDEITAAIEVGVFARGLLPAIEECLSTA